MKRLANILLILSVCGCMPKDTFDKVRKTPKFPLQPTGMVWLRDSLFIDATEVSNIQYRTFLNWEEKNNPIVYKLMLPDTMVWLEKLQFQEPDMMIYFRHPGYANYPVVGVSYRQAIQYCGWRSDMQNGYLYCTHNNIKWNPDSVYNCPQFVSFQLPTKEEWEYAAQAGLDYKNYPLGYEKLTDSKGQPVSNVLGQEYHDVNRTYDSATHKLLPYTGPAVKFYSENEPEPVTYGKPNMYGIYNMLGNVSEIINDSLYMGLNYSKYINGTWLDSTTIYTIKSTYPYYGPDRYLGFRCICRILKK